VKLTHVLDGGGAQAAGLSAGDLVIACDGLRVSQQALDKMLARKLVGDSLTIHAFRRDELLSRMVVLSESETDVKLLAGGKR
jgi:predicted metalloprotease with PDZ domain